MSVVSAHQGPQLPVVRVGGLPIIALSRKDWAKKLVDEAVERRGRPFGPPRFYTSANGNVISLYARDPQFRDLVDTADGIDADGQPVVIASKLLTRTPIPERAATTDTFHDIASAGAELGLSYYLLGGEDRINAAAAAIVTQANPGLIVTGRRNGYFLLADEAAIVAEINAAKPDVLWVGLGVPREHAFIVRNRHRLTGVGVIKSCGGLFDFVAGKHTRAPKWMQDWSLEWLYRLAREPRRLFWRYATTNVHSLILIAARTSDSTSYR